ncbi:MAG: uncharacterized protein JWO36_4487 [Myxococcales bacterium]|nr:uncharacterized protein [Myxococcales bacterium]
MRWILCIVLLAGCPASPTPTGTVCPDPDPNTLTYDNFGKSFMTRYCTWCHDSHLLHSQRNGAPIYHDFDTLLGVLEVPDHIDQETGIGPKASNYFMPGSRCPSVAGGPLDKDCNQPTDQERRDLALWIACERKRPHNFSDGGVDAP